MATAFRPAVAGDFSSIFSALQEGCSEAGEPFEPARAAVWLHALLAESAERVWVIERNRRFAGLAVLQHSVGGSRQAYVSGLYVSPDDRGIGLGPMALGLLRELCRLTDTRLLEHRVELENKLPRIPGRARELAA